MTRATCVVNFFLETPLIFFYQNVSLQYFIPKLVTFNGHSKHGRYHDKGIRIDQRVLKEDSDFCNVLASEHLVQFSTHHL